MARSRLEEDSVGEALRTHTRLCQLGSPLLVTQWDTAKASSLSAGKGSSKRSLYRLLGDCSPQMQKLLVLRVADVSSEVGPWGKKFS